MATESRQSGQSDEPTIGSDALKAAARAFSTGYRTTLGFDGSSVEEAARAAYTPTGPPIAELERRIRERRERPTQVPPAAPE